MSWDRSRLNWDRCLKFDIVWRQFSLKVDENIFGLTLAELSWVARWRGLNQFWFDKIYFLFKKINFEISFKIYFEVWFKIKLCWANDNVYFGCGISKFGCGLDVKSLIWMWDFRATKSASEAFQDNRDRQKVILFKNMNNDTPPIPQFTASCEINFSALHIQTHPNSEGPHPKSIFNLSAIFKIKFRIQLRN